MINTLSLCPTCYKKIPATINSHGDAVYMYKECDVHGKFVALVEKDVSFVTSFYKEGTLGINKSIIVDSYNQCNMNCSWCYYPMGKERIRTVDEVNQILGRYRGFNIMLSGGEPTIDPEFFTKIARYNQLGWNVSAITNMINLADESFIDKVADSTLRVGNMVNLACSFQHPKNHPHAITELKFHALHNLEVRGLQPACIMFSIQTLDELDFILEFYERTKGFYPMIRIRGMFSNWKAKNIHKGFFLSDLYKEFCRKFGKFMPTQSTISEHSNMYCLYLQLAGGTQISLSCAPTVENIDYHQCARPVFMLAKDAQCYPVPLAQIINEGIDNGWKDGFKLAQGGSICG